jgi:hypothetical protein
MGRYEALTIGLIVAVGGSARMLIRSRRQLGVVLRTATVVTLISYPWDFFAIHWRAWAYGEEVPRLLGVPTYDLIFIFVCTIFTASLFSSARRGGFDDLEEHPPAGNGESESNREGDDKHERHDNPR